MMSCLRKRGRLFVTVLCLSLFAHTNTANGQSAVYEIDASHIGMAQNVLCIGKLASELFLTDVRKFMVNSGLSLDDAINTISPQFTVVSGYGDIDCYAFILTYVPVYPLEIIDTVEFGAGDWQGAVNRPTAFQPPYYLVKSVATGSDGQLYSRETLGLLCVAA